MSEHPFFIWYLIGLYGAIIEYLTIPSVRAEVRKRPMIFWWFGVSLAGLLGPIRFALMFAAHFPGKHIEDDRDEDNTKEDDDDRDE